MPRLNHESRDVRQQLEFCLSSDGDKDSGIKSSSNPRHSWGSFALGAGLSALLLIGAPLVYFAGASFGLPPLAPKPAEFALGFASAKATPVAMSLPLQSLPPQALTPQPLTRVPIAPIYLPPPISTIEPVFVRPTTPSPVSMSPIRGLGAHKSTITGIVDPHSLTASYYWTFVLRNQAKSGHEARMEVQLPAGAAVSRATLWVNGHPQEAAFNSTEQVENAYTWITERHRDPLLITQIAPDRILIKASPVVPGHDMKLRIGMTVPLKLNEVGEASSDMPHVLRSNFAFDCKQDVHLGSSAPLSANLVNMRGSQNKDFLLRGNIAAADLAKLTVAVPKASDVMQFATRATHSSPPGFIVATVNTNSGVDRGGTLTLAKSLTKPDCPIIMSTDAAYRLSYLWAHQEIERLANSDRAQAVELASVYREVSSVSGAVVMELESDYSYNALDRNMYRSTSYDGTRRMQPAKAALAVATAAPEVSRSSMAPVAMPAPVTRGIATKNAAANLSDKSANAQADDFRLGWGGNVPSSSHSPNSSPTLLQGDTNGTLGPQELDPDSQAPVKGIDVKGIDLTGSASNNDRFTPVWSLVAQVGAVLFLISGAILAVSTVVMKLWLVWIKRQTAAHNRR